MADLAIGVNCPGCQTLVACGGAYGDDVFYNQCPTCKSTVQAVNHYRVGQTVVVAPDTAPVSVMQEPIVNEAPQEDEDDA